jgi:hypothetical protein
VKLPSAERRRFWAKVAVSLAADGVLTPPLIALTLVRGRAPEWALALHNRFHQRVVGWLFPWARRESRDS